MKIHIKKFEKQYFDDLERGLKTFEIRKDDDDYEVGDLFQFNVHWGESKSDSKRIVEPTYILTDSLYKITYILRDCPQYGLQEGYAIMSVKKVELIDHKEIPVIGNPWSRVPSFDAPSFDASIPLTLTSNGVADEPYRVEWKK